MSCSAVKPTDVVEEHNAASSKISQAGNSNKHMEVVHSLETVVELAELTVFNPEIVPYVVTCVKT
jgi:hypothetical protein